MKLIVMKYTSGVLCVCVFVVLAAHFLCVSGHLFSLSLSLSLSLSCVCVFVCTTLAKKIETGTQAKHRRVHA